MGGVTDADAFFFDDEERSLVTDVLDAVARANPKQCADLEATLGRLRRMAELLRDSPTLSASWDRGTGRPFSAETLVEQLCRVHDYDLDLHIPTKAVVGQAYLVAKINFLKALGYTLAA